MWALLATLPRTPVWVLTSPRTGKPYHNIDKVFARALEHAKITAGDGTPHTLRRAAISWMVEAGMDDYTVMAVSGNSSTRMLARDTHPTEARKLDALATFNILPAVTMTSQSVTGDSEETTDLRELLGKFGGRREDRTPDLRVANAALSQLS